MFPESLKATPRGTLGCHQLHGKSFSCVGSPGSLYVDSGPMRSLGAFSVLGFWLLRLTPIAPGRAVSWVTGFSSCSDPLVLCASWAPHNLLSQKKQQTTRLLRVLMQKTPACYAPLLSDAPPRVPGTLSQQQLESQTKELFQRKDTFLGPLPFANKEQPSNFALLVFPR